MTATFALCLLMAAPATRVGIAMNVPDGGGADALFFSLREQIRLGMDGMHLSYKWQDIEKTPGQVDLKPFTDAAGMLSFMGAEGHLLFQVIDTNQVTLPADLGGKAFDNPELLTRWRELIRKVLPAAGPQVKWVSLSNEVDARLLANPGEQAAFLRFLEVGRKTVKEVRPDAKVSVTVTASCLENDPALARRLWQGMDYLDATYYAQDASFQVKTPEEAAKDFSAILSFDPGRKVVLQEVGMACDPLLGGSEEKQAAFIRQVADLIKSRPDRLDLVSFFIQYDFSPSLVDQFVAYYGVAGPRFRAYLSTLGMKDSTGRPRKAWTALKEVMDALKPL
jgi:hypothetical protein